MRSAESTPERSVARWSIGKCAVRCGAVGRRRLGNRRELECAVVNHHESVHHHNSSTRHFRTDSPDTKHTNTHGIFSRYSFPYCSILSACITLHLHSQPTDWWFKYPIHRYPCTVLFPIHSLQPQIVESCRMAVFLGTRSQ